MNGKIKILHFTISDAAGGITQNILNIWDKIDRNRFQFDFVTMSPSLSYAEELLAQGCKIYYVSTYAEVDEKTFRQEVNDIMSNGYDIVHLHTGYWRGFVLEELAKENKISRIIIHAHNTGVHIYHTATREEAEKNHYQIRELLTEDMATDFWACSKPASDWLFGKQIPQYKIKMIKNGIETSRFLFDPVVREEYREGLGLKGNVVFGHVGRFDVQKNHDFLINVFGEVAHENPGARLMLIGDGPLRGETEKKVRCLKLEDKVVFLGKRRDVNKILQAMDYFVFPSLYEGLGIVLLEAQASGMRCLASNEVPGEVKVTEHLKFLPLKKEIWKEEMLNLSISDYEREDQYENIVQSGYDIDTSIKLLEELYSGKIEEGGGNSQLVLIMFLTQPQPVCKNREGAAA